jgi:hypothetical protein
MLVLMLTPHIGIVCGKDNEDIVIWGFSILAHVGITFGTFLIQIAWL